MKNLVDWFVKAMDRTELSFVTFLSKIVPLLVPIIPAYVGYRHVTNPDLLNFDPEFGWVYAGVIEGLGYAAIYKAVQFWENNKKYVAGSPNRAPLGVAVGIYIVYLVVTLAVNVVLDWVSGVVWYNVLAVGLISILSIPAGLLMSISAVQTERQTERENKKNRTNEQPNSDRTPNEQRTNQPARTNEPRTENRERTNIPMPSANERRTNQRTPNEQPMGFPTTERRTNILAYVERVQANEQRTPGPSEIARAVGVSKSYASEVLNSKGANE